MYDLQTGLGKMGQSAAVTGGGGAIGVLLGLGISLLRQNGAAEWDPGQDAVLISVAGTVLSSVASGLRRFMANRKKHKKVYSPGRRSYCVALIGLLGLASLGLGGCETLAGAGDRLASAEQIVLQVKFLAGAAELYLVEQGATEEQLRIPRLIVSAADRFLGRIAELRATGDGVGADAEQLVREIVNWQVATDTALANARAGV